MALSAARVGLMVRYAPHDFSLLPLVIGALVAAAVSLLTTLPVVVATLRARRLWMVLPATLFLDLVVIIALAVTISAVEADRPPLWALLMMALIPISFFVCLDWGRR